MDKVYDLIIIGGGPAGITAGIYAKRAGMSVCILEKKSNLGGQVYTTSEILNYTGYKKISGPDLTQKMVDQLTENNVEVIFDEVLDSSLSEDVKVIKCKNAEYKSRTVIIATGTEVRRLGIGNEFSFINKGVSYSTLADGKKFAGKVVMVVGGGNSALEDAIYMSNIASKVYLVHRRDRFRGEQALIEKIENIENIEICYNSKIYSLNSENVNLESVTFEDVNNESEKKTISVDCLFVAIGRGVDTDFIDEKVIRTNLGYIEADAEMKTNLDGVFVAGDIRNTPYRQIVCATGDGAIASVSAYKYVSKQKGTLYE